MEGVIKVETRSPNLTDPRGKVDERKLMSTYNEVLALVSRHCRSLLIEDAVYVNLRRHVKKSVNELLSKYKNECKGTHNESECVENIEQIIRRHLKGFYAGSNEPVRVGVFRTLFREAYSKVYGELSDQPPSPDAFIDLVLHGVIRERKEKLIVRLSSLGADFEEAKYNMDIGIDYAFIVSYPHIDPTTGANQSRVIVPFFFIAKSSIAGAKRLRLDEAVEESLKRIRPGQDSRADMVRMTLENMKSFTKVVLTRFNYGQKRKDDDKYPCADTSENGIVIYRDIACAIFKLVFEDIWRAYEAVIERGLAGLTVQDWLRALLELQAPVVLLEISSASDPPRNTGLGGAVIEELADRVRNEVLSKVSSELTKAIDNAKRSVDYFLKDIDQEMSKTIKKMKQEKLDISGRIAITV